MATNKHHLARQVDEQRISAAIKAAELNTSGKIYVTLSPHFWGAAQPGAQHAFDKLRGAHPMDESGVLFFVVPSRRELHVLGGAGIHGKVGQAYWERLVNEVAARIKTTDLTTGILHGINATGEALTQHYPREPES